MKRNASWLHTVVLAATSLAVLVPSSGVAQTSSQFDYARVSGTLRQVSLYFKEALSSTQVPTVSYVREVGGAPMVVREVCSKASTPVAGGCLNPPTDPRELQVRFVALLDRTEKYRIALSTLPFENTTNEENVVVDLKALNKGTLVGLDGNSSLLIRFPLAIDRTQLPDKIEVDGREVDLRSEVRGEPGVYLRATAVNIRFFNKSKFELKGVKSTQGPPGTFVIDMEASGTVKRSIPKGRDDAFEYLGLSYQNEHEKDAQYTADLKWKKKWSHLGAGWFLGHEFDGKFASEGSGNEDRLVFAVGGAKGFNFAKGLDGVSLSSAVEVETDKAFDNTNLLLDTEVFIFSRSLTWSSLRLNTTTKKFERASVFGYLNPYLGLEVGQPASFGKKSAPDYDVRRGKGRFALNITFPLSDKAVQKFVIDIQYTARYLFDEEFINVEKKDKNTGEKTRVVSEIETGWKDYFEGSVGFSFNDHYLINIKYQEGELPPLYTKVDKWSAGFAVKF